MNLVLVLLAALAALDHAWFPAVLLAVMAIMLAVRAFGDCAAAMALQLDYLHTISASASRDEAGSSNAQPSRLNLAAGLLIAEDLRTPVASGDNEGSSGTAIH